MPAHRAGPAGRLATRLFVLFVLAALLPLAVSDGIATRAVTHIAQTLHDGLHEQTTRQVSRQVLDRLVAGKTLLSALPQTQAAPATGSDTPPPGLKGIFDSLTHLDDDGLPSWSAGLAAADVLSLQPLRPADPPGVVPRWRAEQAADVRLHLLPRAGQLPRVVMSARHDGVVRWLATLDPAYLWGPIFDSGERGRWRVEDAQGAALLEHTGADLQRRLPLPDDSVVSRAELFLEGELSAGHWSFEHGTARPSVHWQGAPLGLWLALVALATLLAVALLSHRQILQLLRPLEQLTESTRRLAAGEAHTRVEVGGNDEIGTLGRAFNDMAGRIETQLIVLRGLAAIDHDVLSGAPVDRLARRVLAQLQVLYPGVAAAVAWREADTSPLHLLSGAEAAAGVQRLALDAPQREAFVQALRADGPWQTTTPTTPTTSATASAALPWLQGLAGLPGGPQSWTVTLPLRLPGRAQGLVALGLRQAAEPPALQPAQELRDRLAVAFAARAREQELVHRAVHDSLTGLANRDGLHAMLDARLQAAPDAPTAVLFIDLDHFKDINDSRGHDIGDLVLQQVSQRLRSGAPDDALVARQGGDEFVVVLPGADAHAALVLAHTLLARLEAPLLLPGGTMTLGASVGLALAPEHGPTRSELLRRADIALYQAKAGGRGQASLFVPALDAAAHERLVLQAQLRLALQRGELRVHYQPRVNAASGRITGAEALVRWLHPERGLLSPDAFIEVAESSGLVDALGLAVLDMACAQAAAWRRAALPLQRISVNVSPRQLRSGALPQQVRQALQRHGLPAHALELEVTESLLVGNPGSAHAQLSELRALGVTIALDDFGTGYSSLSVLRQLPIDVMKVDRAFVRDLATDPGAAAVAHAIVALAAALQLHIVAEGVETEAQATRLRALGCHELQGFLFSRPLAPADFEALPGVAPGPAAFQAGTAPADSSSLT